VSPRLYRALLLALPRDRRERYGDQMAAVFADVVRRSPGLAAVMAAWAREITGILRFALRERFTRLGAVVSSFVPARMLGAMPPFGRELRWAWRGFVGRGWRGVMVVALLGIAIAANAVVFAAADSFLFHRVQYPQAERLVEIGRVQVYGDWSGSHDVRSLSGWRGASDLFSSVWAYGGESSAFVSTGDDGSRFVAASSVEPGLMEHLGARLVAGRWLTVNDRPAVAVSSKLIPSFLPTAAVVAESLAATEFGSARAALGRTLSIYGHVTPIVGVVADSFRFPTGQVRIWTTLDPNVMVPIPGSPLSGFSVGAVFQLAPGVSLSQANDRLRALGSAIEPDPPRRRLGASLPAFESRRLGATDDLRLRRLLWLVIGAAACLLFIACANIVNLELASLPARQRRAAVATALGASPVDLAAGLLLEGALVAGAAIAVAAALAKAWLQVLNASLPLSLTGALTNPIDVDARDLIFMVAVGASAWLLTTLPVAVLGLRQDVVAALRQETRSASGSRASHWLRRSLTAVEMAASVALLIGAVLAAGSYSSLLAIPTGFKVAGAAAIQVSRQPGATESAADLQARLLDAMRRLAFVSYVGAASGIPPGGGGGTQGSLTINGQATEHVAHLMSYSVEPDFFPAMGLRLLEGRAFAADDPLSAIVIDEELARREWPQGRAVGSTISMGRASLNAGGPVMTVVGVAAHMRTSEDTAGTPSETSYPVYLRLGDYAPLGFVVRLTDEGRLPDLKSIVRRLAPTAQVRADLISDRYARIYSNEMLAARIMNMFAALAFAISIAGIYSVMTFMVASRQREIGIRMALGADGRNITAMVLNSSLRMVLAGAAGGVVAALIAARWGSSMLFGVSPRDPRIYASVAAVVIVTAVIATWRPALVAARVDPSTLLRK
jgi:predicted permease